MPTILVDDLRPGAYLHRRGIKARIAQRGIEDKTNRGRVRWVIERTISWLRSKRLRPRYPRDRPKPREINFSSAR